MHLHSNLARASSLPKRCGWVLAVAGVLLLAPGGARALTLSVQLGTNPEADYTAGDLGCSATSGTAMECVGSDLTGPSGGWTLNSWDLVVNPDPTISNDIVITNNTSSTQTFIVTVLLPVSPSFGPPSLIRGSLQGGATDKNFDGVTLGTSGANPIYSATIDGGQVRTLADPTISLSGAGSVSLGSYDFGIPIQESVGVATTSDIGITLRFSLSAFDSASFTSVFDVQPVPEPGTALLLTLGLAGIARTARRRA